MKVGIWILLSIIWWLGGFFNMWYLEPNQQSKLVYVPKWMFILFGTPKHRNVPITVQSVWGVYLQIMGISMALYGIFLDQWLVIDSNLSILFGIGTSMVLGIVISRWLYVKRPYSWDNKSIEDKKT